MNRLYVFSSSTLFLIMGNITPGPQILDVALHDSHEGGAIHLSSSMVEFTGAATGPCWLFWPRSGPASWDCILPS